MIHQMNLHATPFEMIERGIKTIERRLYDEKRRLIKVGDEIVFTHSKDSTRTLHCRVMALHIFSSFEELYNTLPLLKCGYTEDDIDTASPDDMQFYYTKEQQKQNGVVGIEIQLMPKLCIFDLDGTVLDTVGSIAHYGNLALEKHGIEPIDVREYQYFAGDGAKILIKRMLNYRGCYSDELHASVFRLYNEMYNADVTCKTVIFDGLKEVLDRLKVDGYRFAIVSNKPDFAAKTVANTLYGDGYFDRIIGQKEGSALKPNPGEVLAVMQDLDVKAKNCVYVGDTDTDMKTGKNAGLYTIGVLWGFRSREELETSGADAIVATPEELYKTIIQQVG